MAKTSLTPYTGKLIQTNFHILEAVIVKKILQPVFNNLAALLTSIIIESDLNDIISRKKIINLNDFYKINM
jgi:hypothetical protein